MQHNIVSQEQFGFMDIKNELWFRIIKETVQEMVEEQEFKEKYLEAIKNLKSKKCAGKYKKDNETKKCQFDPKWVFPNLGYFCDRCGRIKAQVGYHDKKWESKLVKRGFQSYNQQGIIDETK